MQDSLCYSYSFSFPRYSLYNDNSATQILCPFVTFTFYADEPLISKYKIDRGIHVDQWLANEILSNYGSVIPQYAADISHYLIPVKVSINDEVIGTKDGKPFRQWKHTVEGYLQRNETGGTEGTAIKPVIKSYSVSAEAQDNGSVLFKVSVETICKADEPKMFYQVGSDIEDVPGVPVPVSCSSFTYKDSYDEAGVYVWTVVYEGSAVYWPEGEQESQLPGDEVSVSYELNGSTVRTVDGELIALRRSVEPVFRKSIVTYSNSGNPIAVPGSLYGGGIALSENIIKESVSVNGVETASYYKHTIEVEGSGVTSIGTDSDEGGGGE